MTWFRQIFGRAGLPSFLPTAEVEAEALMQTSFCVHLELKTASWLLVGTDGIASLIFIARLDFLRTAVQTQLADFSIFPPSLASFALEGPQRERERERENSHESACLSACQCGGIELMNE